MQHVTIEHESYVEKQKPNSVHATINTSNVNRIELDSKHVVNCVENNIIELNGTVISVIVDINLISIVINVVNVINVVITLIKTTIVYVVLLKLNKSSIIVKPMNMHYVGTVINYIMEIEIVVNVDVVKHEQVELRSSTEKH